MIEDTDIYKIMNAVVLGGNLKNQVKRCLTEMVLLGGWADPKLGDHKLSAEEALIMQGQIAAKVLAYLGYKSSWLMQEIDKFEKKPEYAEKYINDLAEVYKELIQSGALNDTDTKN